MFRDLNRERRVNLGKDAKRCWSRLSIFAAQEQQCLNRNENPLECIDFSKKVAETEQECRIMEKEIKRTDQKISPPRPGQRN